MALSIVASRSRNTGAACIGGGAEFRDAEAATGVSCEAWSGEPSMLGGGARGLSARRAELDCRVAGALPASRSDGQASGGLDWPRHKPSSTDSRSSRSRAPGAYWTDAGLRHLRSARLRPTVASRSVSRATSKPVALHAESVAGSATPSSCGARRGEDRPRERGLLSRQHPDPRPRAWSLRTAATRELAPGDFASTTARGPYELHRRRRIQADRAASCPGASCAPRCAPPKR